MQRPHIDFFRVKIQLLRHSIYSKNIVMYFDLVLLYVVTHI